MSELLNQALNRGLQDWLHTLLAIGIKAAGLPPETTLEDLLAMKIPQANANPNPGCGEDIARIRCSENCFFGSLLLAARMIGGQQAEQIRDCLQGLIWRDAVVLGDAVSYFQDLAASDCVTDDAWQRQDRAEEKWEPWEIAHTEAQKALEDFLYDYTDTQLSYQHES